MWGATELMQFPSTDRKGMVGSPVARPMTAGLMDEVILMFLHPEMKRRLKSPLRDAAWGLLVVVVSLAVGLLLVAATR